ncbi:MAG: hypothetical protein K0U74_09560 [Alphaproteobacteria bacterium]|nr:hypothetical protein [Alphaproteobacteria bacterium]
MTDRRLTFLVALMAGLSILFAWDRGWLASPTQDAAHGENNQATAKRLDMDRTAGRTATFNASQETHATVDTSPQPGASAPRGDTSINPISQLTLTRLEATRARPLFEKSRRPPVAKVIFKARPPEPEPPPPQGPPSLRLIGLAASQDQWIAVIAPDGNSAPKRLKEGDTIDGWRLEVISSTGVVVSKNGEDYPLILFSK